MLVNSSFIDLVKVKNLNSPFTELFSLLKQYEKSACTSNYSCNELKIIQQHVDNAIEVLLQGLQQVGQLIGLATNKKNIAEMNQLGFFISAISNLTEALNDLRLDANFLLGQHENENTK